MSNVNVNKVKEIMQKCSMPLELTVAEFKEQASDMNMPINYLSGYLNKNLQIKNDAIIKWFEYNVRLSDSIRLVKALLERFNKPSEPIDGIKRFDDMYLLIRHGFVFISEEERKQKEAKRKSQNIDELDGMIADSQKELDELEEARANMLEEIEQKRKQILQRMEALRSRVAKLGANQENIQPKKDERIREME